MITTEVANGATRTTTNTYRADGAPATSATSLSGLSGSTSVPALTYAYSATTGLPTTTTPVTGDMITTGYDGWGRQTTYAPASGETTTTGFDSAGQVKTVTDPKGTTTYTYDGTDSLGKTEHRGLTTKIAVSNPSGRTIEVTGAYDAAGALLEQHLPGGITQRSTYDTAGDTVALSYSGQVTTDNGDGTSTVHDDMPWLAWSQDNDASSRVRREWTPSGAAFTGDTDGASGSGYTRDYGYDRASRLVHTTDRTTVPTGSTDPDENPTTSCLQRDYTFDANGNRTALARTPSAADGSCQGTSPTGVTNKTSTYDNADRITTGYTYDALGRVTTLPQTDTPAAAAGGTPGNLTLGYYDTDGAKTVTQNSTTTNYTLDADGRRVTATTGPTGGSAISTLVRHYLDDSDNPGWTASTTSGTTTIERFAEALGGNLELTIAASGIASLPIANIHGDIVSQTNLPTSGAATGLDSWQDNDEYGNQLDTASIGKTPTNPSGVAEGVGYGWVGAKQRATDTSGLLLMGARLYNPATGAFSSTDPVYGGNSAAFAYPQDPINMSDLDGQWGCGGWCKKAGKWAWRHRRGIVLTGVGFIPVAGQASWAFRAYRVGRLLNAAHAHKNGHGRGSIRASRKTSRHAGSIWEGKENHYYRPPKYKNNQKRHTSNFDYHHKGSHLHKNFHVVHRNPWRRAR